MGEAMIPLEYKDQLCIEKITVVDVPDKPESVETHHTRLGSLFAIEDQGTNCLGKRISAVVEKGMGTVQGYEAHIVIKPGVTRT